jgi:hypothetical protein
MDCQNRKNGGLSAAVFRSKFGSWWSILPDYRTAILSLLAADPTLGSIGEVA